MDKFRVAVATSDDIVVNQHFGRASRFQIYDFDEEGNRSFSGIREAEPLCEGGIHSDERIKDAVNNLKDCTYILVSRIGPGAFGTLAGEGIIAFEIPDLIDTALDKMINYLEVEELKVSVGKTWKAKRQAD